MSCDLSETLGRSFVFCLLLSERVPSIVTKRCSQFLSVVAALWSLRFRFGGALPSATAERRLRL